MQDRGGIGRLPRKPLTLRVRFGYRQGGRSSPHNGSEEKKMKYTCTEYREEMLLLALRRQLGRSGLSEEEKKRISEEIRKLEAKMEMS